MSIMEDGRSPEAPGSYGGFLKNNLREYGMLLSLVAIMAVLPVHDRRHAAASRSTSPT
jgi:hypothetical protein